MRFFLTFTKMFFRLLSSSALFCILLVLTSFSVRETFNSDPCSGVKAAVKISKDVNGLSSVKVELTGAQAPVRYFFSFAEGGVIDTGYKTAEVKNLKTGKYFCLVRDSKECRKLIEFEVK
jgi:hypothetical protein